MTLTYAEIAEIIKLIDASSCEEITLDLGEIKLSMRRKGDGGPSATTAAPTAAEESHEAGMEPGPPTDPPAGDEDPPAIGSPRTEASATADGMSEIRSPMVGTFYRAPSPTSPPFVEVGSEVDEDDPLCLIEVMKLYTTISAKGPGRVAEICAENGAMVGADEILFRIEPV